jgi:hypothetical protein
MLWILIYSILEAAYDINISGTILRILLVQCREFVNDNARNGQYKFKKKNDLF